MLSATQLNELVQHINTWATELGFAEVGIADLALSKESERLHAWLDKKYNGSMAWMEENVDKRLQPELLVEDACRSICVRMNYLTTKYRYDQNTEITGKSLCFTLRSWS